MERDHQSNRTVIYKFIKSTIFIIIFILMLFPMSHSQENLAQAQGGMELDYIILIDISGSMKSSGLWNKLSPAIREYLNDLPLGSNVKIYTFGEDTYRYDPWLDIDEEAKEDILSFFDQLDPDDQLTKFWDTVFEAIEYMEEIQENDPNERFQTLISFTDGEDNISQKNPENDILNPYEELCIEGGVYWFHFAYGASAASFEERPCTKVIEPGEAEGVDYTIKNALYIPNKLDLGAIDESGTTITKCFLFYASPKSVYGSKTYKIAATEAELIKGALPSEDVILNVCESGVSPCNHDEIVITQDASCFDFTLYNYNPSDLSEAQEIVFEFPVLKSGQVDDLFTIYPDSFQVKFVLIPEPTPEPTEEATVKPTEDPTPIPTTPEPTIEPTPIPMDVTLTCGEGGMIDFGTIKKPDAGQPVQVKQSCDVVWGEGEVPPNATVSIIWDEEDETAETLAQYLWLEQGGVKAKSIQLSPDDQEITAVLEIPYDAWQNMKRKSFSGGIQLDVKDNTVESPQTETMEASFKVQPPLSPAFYAIPAVGVLAIAGLIIVGTRPRFPKDIKIECMGQAISPSTSINDWWTGAIYLGGGAKSALGLGREEENLVKVKPDGKQSFIGRILNKNADFSAEITPLSDARIKLQTEAIDTIESRTIYSGVEFGIIKSGEYYPVSILKVDESTTGGRPFDDGYEEDIFGGF